MTWLSLTTSRTGIRHPAIHRKNNPIFPVYLLMEWHLFPVMWAMRRLVNQAGLKARTLRGAPMLQLQQMKESADIRNALGTFVTGITVVTTFDNQDRPRGLTANSFTSVSLNPPLILICIGESAASYSTFASCEKFAVNILSERQKQVSALFASKSPDKFEQVQWEKSPGGSPLLSHSLSWIDCQLYSLMPVGDHIILVGKVMNCLAGTRRPLGYFRGGYVRFGLEQDAMDRYRHAESVFGCIVDDGDGLLLCSTKPGEWSVPLSTMANGAKLEKDALRTVLEDIGVEVDLSFIYSIFDISDSGLNYIIYRGLLKNSHGMCHGAHSKARFFRAGEIPWDTISHNAFRNMLKRYVTERDSERFGIYVESDSGGQVAVLDGQPQPWEKYANMHARNTPSTAGMK